MVLRAYETFLLSNASQITAVESSLRSLTYFLPGRFKDAELAGEAIYSAMNLLGLYHDQIVKRLVIYTDINVQGPQQHQYPHDKDNTTSIDQHTPLPHTPSSHARYTTYYSNRSSAYKTMATMLVVIGYTQLLAEMVARRNLNRKRAWDVVVAIEAIKASLRLALFNLSSSRLSINPPIPEREVDPTMLEAQREEALLARLRQASSSAVAVAGDGTDEEQHPQASAGPGIISNDTWTGSRTGLVRPTLASLRKDNARIDPVTGQPILDSPGMGDSSILNLPPLVSRPVSRSRSRSRLSSQSGDGADEDDDDSDSSEETLVEPSSGLLGGASTRPLTQHSIDEYLTSRAVSREDVLPPPMLVRSFLSSRRGTLSELLWILRPLLYLLTMRKWGSRRWEPWTISLMIEATSHFLRRSAYKTSELQSQGSLVTKSNLAPLQMLLAVLTSSSSNPLVKVAAHLGRSTLSSSSASSEPNSSVEAEEWSRRKRAFLWYLLRGPLWHTWTKHKIVQICTHWQDRALLGIPAGMVREYVPLVDGFWFYTASQ